MDSTRSTQQGASRRSFIMTAMASAALAACGGGGGGGGGPGDNPLLVSGIKPGPLAVDVLAGAGVEVTFSRAINPASLDEMSFGLWNTLRGRMVAATLTPAGDAGAKLTPVSKLAIATTFNPVLTAAIRARDGTALTPYESSFTTADGRWSAGLKYLWEDTARVPVLDMGLDDRGHGFILLTRMAGGLRSAMVKARDGTTGEWRQADTLINTEPGSAVENPRMVVSANGVAVVVWRFAPAGGVTSLWFSRADTLLPAAWTAPARINTVLTEDVHAAFGISTDATGSPRVCWTQAGVLYTSRFDRETDTWSASPDLAEGASQVAPTMATNARGQSVVVWAEGVPAAYKARRLAADGQPSGPSLPLLELAPDTGITAPRVTVGANGDAVIAWGLVGNGAHEVFSRRLRAGSAAFDDIVPMRGAKPNFAKLADIAMDPRGNVVAAWTENSADGTIPWTVHANTMDAATGHWGQAAEVSRPVYPGSAQASASTPVVAMDPAGNAFVAWTKLRSDGVTDQWAARYHRPTAAWREADRAAFGEGLTPYISFTARGEAVSLWEYKEPGQDPRWASRTFSDQA